VQTATAIYSHFSLNRGSRKEIAKWWVPSVSVLTLRMDLQEMLGPIPILERGDCHRKAMTKLRQVQQCL
jgi:hypothetical protein